MPFAETPVWREVEDGSSHCPVLSFLKMDTSSVFILYLNDSIFFVTFRRFYYTVTSTVQVLTISTSVVWGEIGQASTVNWMKSEATQNTLQLMVVKIQYRPLGCLVFPNTFGNIYVTLACTPKLSTKQRMWIEDSSLNISCGFFFLIKKQNIHPYALLYSTTSTLNLCGRQERSSF